MKLRGRTWLLPDDVDTDQIISGKYLTIRDPVEMSKHVFEELKPQFFMNVKSGDMILAGRNFGSGSSREEAPVLLKRLGISLVVAKSFARLFFRNSINIGLPAVESNSPISGAHDGDVLEADIEKGTAYNATRREVYALNKLPVFLLDVLRAGGAVEAYREKRLVSRPA